MSRGAKTSEGSNITFYQIADGAFKRRVPEATKTSVPRVQGEKAGINEGRTVHEEYCDSLTGLIVSIEKVQKDWGKVWETKILVSEDGAPEEFFVLTLPYSSGYANNILKRIPNMDLTADTTLNAYSFTPKGETKVRKGISMVQDIKGSPVKILPFYTKDQPNDIPQMEQIEVSGELKWDDSKALNFLTEMVKKAKFPQAEPVAAATEEAPEETGNEDKVPF